MKLILIHGLGQDPSTWDESASLLPTQIDRLCPDLLALSSGKEVTYANLYCAFSDYCDGISEPLNLCGLSLGGILALNYAIDHPERTQSLILISAQYKMPKTMLQLQNIIFRFMPDSCFKSMGFGKRDFIRLTKSMMALDFSVKLKDIKCTTLVLCGEKDVANRKAGERLAENIQGASYRLIKGAGHEVNIESPKRLAAEIETFIIKTLT